MLSPRRMRVSIEIVLLAALSACQDEEPSFAPAGSIRDRRFPGETTAVATTAPFPKPFDDASPAPEPELATRHKAFATLDPRIDCMVCHAAGKTSTKTWLFGGHVAAKNPRAVVEVVLTSADQKTVLAHVKASTDGYVWAPKTGPDLPADARVAVRTKEESAAMTGEVSTPGCNATACHGGTTPPVTVPK